MPTLFFVRSVTMKEFHMRAAACPMSSMIIPVSVQRANAKRACPHACLRRDDTFRHQDGFTRRNHVQVSEVDRSAAMPRVFRAQPRRRESLFRKVVGYAVLRLVSIPGMWFNMSSLGMSPTAIHLPAAAVPVGAVAVPGENMFYTRHFFFIRLPGAQCRCRRQHAACVCSVQQARAVA